MMKSGVVFRERFAEAMRAKGLTQAMLGRLMNVNQTTISRWLNGKREPDYNLLMLLCAILDETPNFLLGYDEEEAHKNALIAVKQAIFSDSEFQNLKLLTEKKGREEGKTDKEIEMETKQIFEDKFSEYCKKYRFEF